MNKKEAQALCFNHMHRYVSVTMSDGAMFDGIVEHVDEDQLYLAVPVGNVDHEAMRAFAPYPYGGYPYGYPYPYPGYGFPRRRFVRQVLPLAGLLALSLLPYY
ncbi:hypothetical protein [Paenibacillus hexagrammi]|uniref:Phosphatidylinositol kinase n=1 Tax=Paenibacillus hexagrammi TaxID=2908839 RepID=A0ABY3SMI2_9BACL|nr:hypothetical protein [Paenibacillus sp. YPD9-1]UJF35072.1 hypothetical protein L0M14_08000 [Paenibacillus sp. YPD9-1]